MDYLDEIQNQTDAVSRAIEAIKDLLLHLLWRSSQYLQRAPS